MAFQEINATIYSLSHELSNDFEFEEQFILPKQSLAIHIRILRFILRFFRWAIPIWWFQKLLNIAISGINIDLITNKVHWDVILVEHIDFLPLAIDIKQMKGCKIIFDMRDYYPREFEKYFMFRWLEAGFRKSVFKLKLIHCDQIITVSNGLIRGLKKEYGVDAHLIRSLPSYNSIKPVKVDSRFIKMVHHGSANGDRGLIEMIDFFNKLDEQFTLDLYLVGDKKEITRLKNYAKCNDRIVFNEPVYVENLVNELNKFDIGLLFFQPTTFNLRNCLPNKLFEMIQAKLMILTTPIDGIAEVVINHQCGIVLPSFNPDECIQAINKIDAKTVYQWKLSTILASEQLCFEKEKYKFEEILSA